MNSFMSWIGGKKALRGKILELFPEKEFKRYIEVFGGAGWVLFASDKHAKMEVYNDMNGDLVNLFRCIKYHPETLQQELDFIFMSREQFVNAKKQLEVRGMTDIQRAARFFILIKESFGTDLRSFRTSARNIENAVEYLSAVSSRLKDVLIENLDFERLINTYDREDAFFYCDPPYYLTEKYYEVKFVPEDHIRLKHCLERIHGQFLLSYNDCEFIRKLYSNYTIVEVDRLHNLVIKNDKKPRYREVLIKNY